MILKLQSSQRLVSSSRPHCHVAGKAPGPEVEAASRHEALTAEFEARRLGEGMGEDCLHLVTSFLETRNFEMARNSGGPSLEFLCTRHWQICGKKRLVVSEIPKLSSWAAGSRLEICLC